MSATAMLSPMGEEGTFRSLRHDFELIALRRVKRIGGEPTVERALERLVAAGLASMDGDAMTLMDPATAEVPRTDPEFDILHALYAFWLQADPSEGEDEILYGELGYWQHWWNALREHGERLGGPLRMDFVVPEDAPFIDRDWMSDFDPKIVEHVVSQSLLAGRVIVPPSTLGSPAQDLVEFALRLDVEVRVFPARVQFVIYDGESVVVRDGVEGELERHRRSRQATVVAPLRELFDFQWVAAIPWGEHEKGAAGILQLLAQDWTDERIARALGVSTRTVSRRISRMMEAAGVQSRFALGMRFARSETLESAP